MGDISEMNIMTQDATFGALSFFKVNLRMEPYSITFSDLFFRNIRLNRHIEVISYKSIRR